MLVLLRRLATGSTAFISKLCCHWLNYLQQRWITIVIQSPGLPPSCFKKRWVERNWRYLHDIYSSQAHLAHARVETNHVWELGFVSDVVMGCWVRKYRYPPMIHHERCRHGHCARIQIDKLMNTRSTETEYRYFDNIFFTGYIGSCQNNISVSVSLIGLLESRCGALQLNWIFW